MSNDVDLWCVHILGPDDLYPCVSRAAATLMAADINAKFGSMASEHEIMLRAVVDPWPYSPEAHAEGLIR